MNIEMALYRSFRRCLNYFDKLKQDSITAKDELSACNSTLHIPHMNTIPIGEFCVGEVVQTRLQWIIIRQ